MTAPEAVRETLPHWDLTPFFPGVESPEFDAAFDEFVTGIASLGELFDAHDIRGGASPPTAEAATALDEILERLNALLERSDLLEAYLYGHVTVDSRDEAAQGRLSELLRESVALKNLDTRLTAWLGGLDADELVRSSEAAQSHEFAVRRAQVRAQHLMSAPEEELAAELDLTGATAWQKLHSDLTSQIVVTLELDGEEQELPMSEVRNLSTRPERDVRRAAYEAELEAWEHAAVPLAAALNSIKGQVNGVSERRRWESALDEALFGNNIDRGTLDAMLDAVRDALPDLRRYPQAKARALGLDRLAWFDLDAPLGADEDRRAWAYGEARDFIVEQFGTYSDAMRKHAERAFGENWIDAEPRAGKSDGGFCMPVRGDESRILCNYVEAYDGVSVLAHELGHAYHNVTLAPRTQIQKRTPMTLAETASIFCETIVRNGALAAAEGAPTEQLQILEGSLQSSFGTTVDILSRFLFESRVLERRAQRELSVRELCELMLEAQEETYGDALDPEARHAYMWAMKPHYYSTYSFYNYPYTFGFLFGLGLYARYEQDPEEFRSSYDDLLSSTGLADAATLANRFGIDVRAPEFWRSSLDLVRADIERYERLAA